MLLDAAIDTRDGYQGTRDLELRVKLRAGEHSVGAAFLSELLCALRIGPDAGILERAGDFD